MNRICSFMNYLSGEQVYLQTEARICKYSCVRRQRKGRGFRKTKMGSPSEIIPNRILELRFDQHQNGEVQSTRNRRPLRLIYYEACINQYDAIRREKYLKTHYGKMFLKNRLRDWNDENS